MDKNRKYYETNRKQIHKLTRAITRAKLLGRVYENGVSQFERDLALVREDSDHEFKERFLTDFRNRVEMLVSNCTQSYEAMPKVLVEPAVYWPFFAISRIALESSARLIYLLDSEIAFIRRIMRAAAFIAWSHIENRKAINAGTWMPIQERNDKILLIEAKLIELKDQVQSFGLIFTNSGSDVIIKDPSNPSEPETSNFNASQKLGVLFPDIGAAYYRSWSGFLHGAPWALLTSSTPIAQNVLSPRSNQKSVVDAFYLVGAAISRALENYQNFSGAPNRNISKQFELLKNLSQQEAERLELDPQPNGLKRRIRVWWAGRIAKAWAQRPLEESHN